MSNNGELIFDACVLLRHINPIFLEIYILPDGKLRFIVCGLFQETVIIKQNKQKIKVVQINRKPVYEILSEFKCTIQFTSSTLTYPLVNYTDIEGKYKFTIQKGYVTVTETHP